MWSPRRSPTLNSALILWIGGLRAVEGHISVGLLVAFQALVTRFTAPDHPAQRRRGPDPGLRGRRGPAQGRRELPGRPALRAARAPATSTRRLQGHVELENITFGYSPLDKPLLTGFSLTVGPGQQVALVGGSGSGKSTVVPADLRACTRPWEGTIRIDGQRLEDIPRGALAASVSFVDQDVFLFEGTVRDNVALWDPSIPDEAVVAALRGRGAVRRRDAPRPAASTAGSSRTAATSPAGSGSAWRSRGRWCAGPASWCWTR